MGIRILQVFLIASQTYLQPPDIIDLYIRNTISRKRPYPLCTIPLSTEIYQRPLITRSSGIPPRRVELTTTNILQQQHISTTSLSHIRIILRASFHQSCYIVSPYFTVPAEGELYGLHDYANQFYQDRAITTFEMYEVDGQGLKSMRDVFGAKWNEVLWGVWWWAGSGEKARAKMERWRR